MREELIRRVGKRVAKKPDGGTSTTAAVTTAATTSSPATLSFTDSDPLPYSPPDQHHHISQSKRFHQDTSDWLSENKSDPALKVCASKASVFTVNLINL